MTLRELIKQVLADNLYNKKDKDSLNTYMSAFPVLDYELEIWLHDSMSAIERPINKIEVLTTEKRIDLNV